jgi:AcrR family transcriptional regulator
LTAAENLSSSYARITDVMSPEAATARRYGGKTAHERQAERRERLLDAGLQLFGTQGFAATTIEALCASARLNPRYFYEGFPSREALLGAVYERHVTTVADAVMGALDGAPSDPLTRLDVGLRAFLDGTLVDARAARVNYFEVIGVSRELEQFRRDVLRRYAGLIAGEITAISERTPLAMSDPHSVAVAMVGAVDGLVIDALTGERGYDREQIVTTLRELLGGLMRAG